MQTRTRSRLPALLLALAPALALGAPLGAAVAEPAVMRVVVVEAMDAKEFRHELDKLLALERTVVPEASIRVWRARFAGADTGTLIVAAEVPSLAALAKIDEFGKQNGEFAATMRRLTAMTRVISDSLYEEITH